MRNLHILTTGGTIDKVYFDALSEFQVGGSALHSMFDDANLAISYQITELMRKDSLELTDGDRHEIEGAVRASNCKAILVTHGTDTMVETAKRLVGVDDRTVVFTGAMQPARLRSTDAIFNVGFAIAATQLLPAGTYIAMNGQVFDPTQVLKDRNAARFVARD